MMTFVCAFVLGVAAGCNGDKNANIIESNDSYKWTYTQPFVDDMDDDMKIDGKLEESRWTEGGKKWLTHTEKDVELRYTTAFTQKGLYIAAEAKDPGMQWNDTRDFANNSSFYFYIISNKATEYHAFDCMGFYVDELNSACRQNSRFAAKGLRTEVNGVPTLTAEFFASWKALNYTVDKATGMPEEVNFLPQYRYVAGVNSTENTYLKPALAETGGDRVKNAYSFNGDGYINVDVDGVELGNAVTGFAKSDGWDLSNIKGENKSLTANRVGDQAIFFKDINSSRYSYSVDITFNESYNDGIPAVGVFDMKNAADFNIMWFHGEDIANNKNSYRYFLRDLHTGRSDTQQGNLDVTSGSKTIKIRVIKDDSRLYYIFNGKYEFGVDLNWLGGKSIPGLYTFGANATFSNWEVTDFESAEKDAQFKDLCATYMHTVNIDGAISGGTVTTDNLAVAVGSGDSVKLSIAPTRGYVLTDFTLNGESVYDRVISEMTGGVFTITPDRALNIGATFSAMPASETLRITGNVKRSNGTALIGMSYSVHSEQEANTNILYNYGTTTSAGIFDITVLKAGTHTIGGKTVITDGKYTLTFDGIFSRGDVNSIVIDTTDEKFSGQSYHAYGDVILNPVKALQMAETTDGKIQTTNLKVNQSEKFSYFVGTDEVTGSFELTMTINAKNDAWPCYGITVEDENNNAMSLFAAGPKYYRIMKSYDGVNYTHADKGTTYKDGISNLKLVYDAKKEVFMFYVNGALFDTLKRSDYLTGTTFKYGPVGYMVGADGYTGDPVTDENPFATFTKPVIIKEYTLSLPTGATVVTSDGTAITDGKVPVLSTVTVTIPVSGNNNYMIYVDGIPVATTKEEGKISATFGVTANSSVTYEKANEISGSVVLGDKYPALKDKQSLSGVEVLFAGENGNVVYTAITDKDGNFTASLPDGAFYVGAKGDCLVSDSIGITVTGGLSNVNLTLNKPALDEQIFEAELGYDAKTGNYVQYGAHGQKAAGFLAGASHENGNSYVVSVKMSNLGNDWPSGGFAIGNSADKFVKFEIVKSTSNTYILRIKDEVTNGEVLWWFNNITEFNKYNELDEFTFKVVYTNGNYYIFLEGDLLVTVPETTALGGTTVKSAVGSGKTVKLGLYGEEIITFSEYAYSYADADIKALVGRTLTLDSGLTATVMGMAVTNGEVLLGDEVTVTIDASSGKSYNIMVDGAAIPTVNENGKATAIFKVTGNHSVTYSLSYEVSGSVTGGDENTIITVATTSGVIVYTGKGATFNAMLADGNYIVTAQGTDKVSNGVKFTVDGNAVSDIEIVLNKLTIGEQVYEHEFIYNSANGSFYAEHTPEGSPMYGGYFDGVTVAEGKDFVLSATMKDMGASMWPSTGLLVGTSTENYMRFGIIRNTDGGVFGLQVRSATGKETISWFDTEPFTKWAKPFGEDGTKEFKLELVYHNGVYFVFFNGELAAKYNENDKVLAAGETIAAQVGTGDRKLGVYAERQIIYTDWGYSAATDDLNKYLSANVTANGMKLTVNGKEVTNGSVLLGDDVTVSVDVSAGQDVSILVDGQAQNIIIANSKATATFKVTGNHTVTMKNAYVVSGTATNGAVVTVANADGSVAKTVIAEDGAFSITLPNGTYYLTAQTTDNVSTAFAVTVNNQQVNGIALTANKLKIGEHIIDNGWFEFNYNVVNGSYEVTNSEAYNNGGYFAGVTAGDRFILKAMVNEFTGTYPSAGFIVQTANGNVRFALRWRPDWNRYDCVSWNSAKQNTDRDVVGDSPFVSGKTEMMLVYNNGTYFFYAGDKLMYSESGYDAPNGKVGLFCERAVTYTDWGYTTDADELKSVIGKTLTLANGVSATVNGQAMSGSNVLLGDTVTVSVEIAEGQEISILIDGKAQQNITVTDGKATVEFKVTDNHSVTYSTAYAVSGTAVAGAMVTFANSDGSIDKQITAGTDGTFSVTLPDGTYYASAETAAAVSAVTKVAVNGNAVSGLEIRVNRALITDKVFAEDFKFSYVDGSLYSLHDGNGTNWYGGYFDGATVAEGKDFVLSATMKGMGASMWPSTGLLVGTSTENYMRFDIIRNTDRGVFGLQVRSATGKENISWFNVGSKFANPFSGEDGTLELKLIYHNGLYSVYFNNVLAAQFDETAATLRDPVTIASIASQLENGVRKLGFYAERQITLVDWSFETTDVTIPAEARVKGFDGVTAFKYDTESGAFKSVWNNNNQRSVTDIDVKNVQEWVWSADVHVMSDWAYPSVGLALYNGENTKDFIIKIIRLTPPETESNKDSQTCQLKIGATDFGADAGGNSTKQWVDSHKTALKDEVRMSLVHNANGYYLFIGSDLVWSTTDNIVDGWDSVRLGFFAEQEASVRNLTYSTDISGYNTNN